MKTWLKSRYYPVNINTKVIYDDPQARERDCCHLSSRIGYAGKGTMGVKGCRLAEHARLYDTFAVEPGLSRKARLSPSPTPKPTTGKETTP